MRKSHVLRFAHRVSRKILNIQIQAFNRAFDSSTRFSTQSLGADLLLPVCVGTGFGNISWRKSWKTQVIRRLARPDQGTFVDVGANVGQTLLDVYATNPSSRYLGFEPNIANAFYLGEMIRANSLSNFNIVPVGLADENRCLSLYLGKGTTEDLSATVRIELRPTRESEAVLIPCFKFDDIRHSGGVKEISFIKIDVEGAELETLIGMKKCLQECRPIVLCEVLFAGWKADLVQHEDRNNRLIQHLRDLSYRVFQLIKSSNREEVVDARSIDKFDTVFWSPENENLCDYVLIPAEKETHTLKALLSSS